MGILYSKMSPGAILPLPNLEDGIKAIWTGKIAVLGTSAGRLMKRSSCACSY